MKTPHPIFLLYIPPAFERMWLFSLLPGIDHLILSLPAHCIFLVGVLLLHNTSLQSCELLANSMPDSFTYS